jgi:hypothetical protein
MRRLALRRTVCVLVATVVAVGGGAVIGGLPAEAHQSSRVHRSWEAHESRHEWLRGYPYVRFVHDASYARPTARHPVDREVRDRLRRSAAPRVWASAGAVAQSRCDGCAAEAVTLQVLYASGSRQVVAKNTARASSSCTGCRSAALSLQIVVALRPDRVRAVNTSEAVNVSCDSCTTTSAAYQFVVAADSRRELSAMTRGLIEQVRAQMAVLVEDHAETAGSPQRTAQIRASLARKGARLEELLERDLGGKVAKRELDVRADHEPRS